MILESSNQYFPFCRSTNMHRFKRRFKKIFSFCMYEENHCCGSIAWFTRFVKARTKNEKSIQRIPRKSDPRNVRNSWWILGRMDGKMNLNENERGGGGKKWKSMVFLSFLSFLRDRSQWLTVWLTTLTSFLSSMTNYSIYETTFVTVQVLSMYFFFSNSNTLVISL